MGVYLVCYIVGFLSARWEYYYISGLAFMIAAVVLYLYDYLRSKNLIHLRGLFSLSWVGGQALACLKLSELQEVWETKTWICFALAFLGFWIVFEVLTNIYGSGHDAYGRWRSFTGNPKPIFHIICAVSLLSFASFIFEAIVLGYVPLFMRGVPHAYSEFHLTGVHYFTVSCVLVPALSVLFFHMERGRWNDKALAAIILMNVVALMIPILCVSRFQFVFAVLLAIFTYISLQKSFSPLYLAGAVAVLLPVYLILTVARSHNVEYLMGIFEMKWDKMPIFIAQPYIYIANNYDNFNCMVNVFDNSASILGTELSHSFGMKGLFPLWALTGLKFFFPQLVNYPNFIVKKELTTITMFYNSFYDFGVIGVIFFSCLLGLVAYLLVVKLREMRNPLGYLLYAQIALYLMLSFFTTWFSDTTTWFYLVLTAMMTIYYQFNEHKR
ncbi:MAG: O-antigen polymerase [Lachnospiraceae bacterium]